MKNWDWHASESGVYAPRLIFVVIARVRPAIMDADSKDSGVGYARPGRLRPNVGIILLNQQEPGVLGQAVKHPFLAVSAGRHQARRDRPSRRCSRELHEEVGLRPEHVRIVGRTRDWLRYEVPDQFIRRDAARPLPRPEADLVSAAAGRPRLRPQPARHRPSRVRRLALARLLGAARRRDRVQARRLSAGTARTFSLCVQARPPAPQGLSSRARQMRRIARRTSRMRSRPQAPAATLRRYSNTRLSR